MKTKKNRVIRPSIEAVTLLLVLCIGGLWLIAMSVCTYVKARDLAEQAVTQTDQATADALRYKFNDYFDPRVPQYGALDNRPDLLAYTILGSYSSTTSYLNIDRFKIPVAQLYRYQGEVVDFSYSDNIICFDYYTEDEWQNGKYTTGRLHLGYTDLNAVGENGVDIPVTMHDPHLIRITGTVAEDGKITPSAIYLIRRADLNNYYSFDGIKELLEDGRLKWTKIYDSGNHAEDAVTLYATSASAYCAYGYDLHYGGERYSGLLELFEYYYTANVSGYPQNPFIGENPNADGNLLRMTVLDTDWLGDMTLHTAVQISPLLMAAISLQGAYLMTAAAAAALIIIARRVIKKQLIRPMQRVIFAADNLYACPDDDSAPALWREPDQLIELYDQMYINYTRTVDENTSLRTSLDYSRQAEQYRRRLTSNLTHELKTPLAILRSYAEGLKEHIAEDKRDRYVEIILSQIDQTDAMIQSMLELSRLEAGKVKLRREQFDLSELTRGILERFELMYSAKQLKVATTLLSPCVIHADRGRIAQAVENLISNAVKYTPAGGNIELSVYQGQKATYFTVKNDCTGLSAQELEQVFEPFYRADKSRSSEGTGLGLSITKNIIELHGGSMTVKGNSGSVEFGFRL
ncbi:MAG: HAMP domain-containing histidine kinase [Clostridia bacterium]|nr:HAMP domain-containing histidine kinase [Clostridia bacterium]